MLATMFYDYTAHPRKTAPHRYDAVKRLQLATRATDPYRLLGRDARVLATKSPRARAMTMRRSTYSVTCQMCSTHGLARIT